MAVYTKPVVKKETPKAPVQPKYNAYSAPSTGYGTVAQHGKSVGYTDKNAEIARTQSVIAERQKAGMDISAQLNHYKNLTGKTYSAPKTTSSPSSYNAPTSISTNAPKYGFGTDGPKVGWTDKNAEINRTVDVITNRFNDDMDIAAQLSHYKNLTGKDYTQDWAFKELGITKDMTKSVQAEIEAKKLALQQQLAMQQQANNSAVSQNNAYLQEQLGKLQKQKTVTDNQSQMLANRRGGFYSGGLDYQLGQNASSFNEASGGLQRDIAARNAEIYARNSLLANQAAEQISQLQQSAPSLIRQRVLEEMNRQRGIMMDEAQLTGQYNGAPTIAYQDMQFDQGIKRNQLDMQKQEQAFEQNLQLQQFAYSKLRNKIEDERWKAEFDEDVRRFGLSQALERQVSLGNLGVRQAELALSQAKFEYDKSQPKNATKDESGQEISAKDLSKNYATFKSEIRSAISSGAEYSEIMQYVDGQRDLLNDKDYRALLDFIDDELNKEE